jgi:hypothetical protein
MPRSSDGDDLIARIVELEPARGTPPLSRRAIRHLTRAATNTKHDAQAWTWPKYRLASLGALVGSSALVVAAIVGLDSLGTPVATFATSAPSAIRTTSHPRLPPVSTSDAYGDRDFGDVASSLTSGVAACPLTIEAHSDGDGLRRGPGRATAYQIASPLSPRRALLSLAPDFGLGTSRVRWFAMGAHARGWWVGKLSGPSLTTYSARGITWWSYAAPRESMRRLVHDAGERGRNVLSGTASARDAERLLEGLVSRVQLSNPTEARSSTSVEVAVPLAVHGVMTDEHFAVDYFPGGRLAAANGPLTSVVREVSYPAITPLYAAQLLRQPKGALVGLLAPSSTGSAGPPTGAPVSTLYCNAMQSIDSVSSATMTLSTNVLSDGRVWLLPSWTFSATDDQYSGAKSVAISPRYLDYLPASIRYSRQKGTR